MSSAWLKVSAVSAYLNIHLLNRLHTFNITITITINIPSLHSYTPYVNYLSHTFSLWLSDVVRLGGICSVSVSVYTRDHDIRKELCCKYKSSQWPFTQWHWWRMLLCTQTFIHGRRWHHGSVCCSRTLRQQPRRREPTDDPGTGGYLLTPGGVGHERRRFQHKWRAAHWLVSQLGRTARRAQSWKHRVLCSNSWIWMLEIWTESYQKTVTSASEWAGMIQTTRDLSTGGKQNI